MTNLTSVGVTAGVPTSGTGTVSTIDNLIGTAGTAVANVLSVQGIASGTAQPVSAASLPLPTGAATAALQTTLNTAIGSPMQQTGGTVGIVAGSATLGSVKLTDGTNTTAVKASSTAPIATDPAAVVTISPNSAGLVNLGQVAKSASVPVTIASDHFGGTTPANSFPVVNAGFSFLNISTAATTTVKSGAGVVHTITVNNLGTVASATTVYDNTAASGTKIATINTLAGQTSYIYDVAFSTGLTLVTTGTVAPDITVSYR